MFGFGEVMARSTWVTAWLAGSSGFCLSVVTLGFFFFFNMGFCSGGILVDNGGVVGMAEARWW